MKVEFTTLLVSQDVWDAPENVENICKWCVRWEDPTGSAQIC